MRVFVFACYLWGAPFATSLSLDRQPSALRAQSVLPLNERPSAERRDKCHTHAHAPPKKKCCCAGLGRSLPGGTVLHTRALQCRVRSANSRYTAVLQ